MSGDGKFRGGLAENKRDTKGIAGRTRFEGAK